jgi:hypothetical protein
VGTQHGRLLPFSIINVVLPLPKLATCQIWASNSKQEAKVDACVQWLFCYTVIPL